MGVVWGFCGCTWLLDEPRHRCKEANGSTAPAPGYVCVAGFWERASEDDAVGRGGEGDERETDIDEEATGQQSSMAERMAGTEEERPVAAGSDGGDGRDSDPDAEQPSAAAGSEPPPAEMSKPTSGEDTGEDNMGAEPAGPVEDVEADAEVTCVGPRDPAVFFVDGPQIFDAAGCPFVPYGFNGTVFFLRGRDAAQEASLQAMAAVGANAVRIVATTSGQPLPTPADPNPNPWWNADPQVQARLVELALDAGLVPILDMHDYGTCTPESGAQATWERIAAYWLSADMIALAQSQPALWLNLASRMEFESDQAFFDAYSALVKQLRERGVHNLLLVDAATRCGQDPQSIVQRGTALQQADPDHNLVFAIHAFAEFALTDDEVTEQLTRLTKTRLPFVVAAFAWDQPRPRKVEDYIYYSPEHLVRQAQNLGVGWIFWSWFSGDMNPEQRVVESLAAQDELNAAGQFLRDQLQRHAQPAQLVP